MKYMCMVDFKFGLIVQGRRPWVSLRLGHAAALDATGIHSLPRRRFATPLKPFLKEGFKNPKNF